MRDTIARWVIGIGNVLVMMYLFIRFGDFMMQNHPELFKAIYPLYLVGGVALLFVGRWVLSIIYTCIINLLKPPIS